MPGYSTPISGASPLHLISRHTCLRRAESCLGPRLFSVVATSLHSSDADLAAVITVALAVPRDRIQAHISTHYRSLTSLSGPNPLRFIFLLAAGRIKFLAPPLRAQLVFLLCSWQLRGALACTLSLCISVSAGTGRGAQYLGLRRMVTSNVLNLWVSPRAIVLPLPPPVVLPLSFGF